MKNILLALAVVLALAACAGNPRSRADLALYDLGPGPVQPSAAAYPGVALEVRLPVWLDAPAMSYRLTYADPRRVHAYAQARWAASPLLLLQQRLRQLLALSAGGAPCLLRVELDEFSQSFASPGGSSAVVRGEAQLFGKGGAAKGRRPLSLEVPAATADAAGGAAALALASERLAAILNEWLQTQDLAACRTAG
ncbi:MAG TPA: ABC-type transport auxiliary lipoprotein family protein [Azospira sp.]|nr:ABC-type transport auxiliary lipoprotein family protein [Azospira sp.]